MRQTSKPRDAVEEPVRGLLLLLVGHVEGLELVNVAGVGDLAKAATVSMSEHRMHVLRVTNRLIRCRWEVLLNLSTLA